MTTIFPPFAKRRGTRAQRAGGCPQFTAVPPPRHSRGRGNPEKSKARHFHPNNQHALHRNPPTTTTCPLSREPSPSPSQGEGNRAAKGRGPPPKPPTSTNHRNNPLSHHPILPILSNLSHPSSGVSQSTPISKCPLFSHISVLPNSTLDTYRAVVLAFSLYKLVSDRRIWTPIKSRLDEGTKVVR